MGQITKALPRPRSGTSPAATRCAIYTRKSSEEGLEQEFNSLHAQREACEAYVLSQRHEGWTALPSIYDDGGISGGTMERPALQRLLADIAAGRIDTVVVYKVDRLTRSLSDFARIVDVFDAAGVSFVSVTQQFNTTTSMGRLTLNMLLSFAQFEREVTGERIRDKVAASKRKGMWMGGVLPIGYDVQNRKLVVNEEEAKTVRHIFTRYLALGSVQALKEELTASGIVSKRRVNRHGRESGGVPFARGALYCLLQNRIYIGEIVHKEQSFPGEHAAIVGEALWQEVQDLLERNRVDQSAGTHAIEPSLLVGLVHDDAGERMSPTHANKKSVRYRYYVSQSLLTGPRADTDRHVSAKGRRIPAGDLEGLVSQRIVELLQDRSALIDMANRSGAADAATRGSLIDRSADLAARWPTLVPAYQRAMLRHLIERIDVRRETIELAIRPAAIERIADPKFDHQYASTGRQQFRPEDEVDPESDEQDDELATDDDAAIMRLIIPVRLKRTGRETRLVIEGTNGPFRRESDRSLLRLIAQAQQFRTMMLEANGASITELADEAAVTPSYFTRVLRLSFLSPAIVRMILDGEHPMGLSAKHLSLHVKLPGCWQEQAKLLTAV